MNNLSNKELCILYLLTQDLIIRCRQSSGVDYPLGNIDVFEGLSRKLLDGIVENRTNYEQNRIYRPNTIADKAQKGTAPKLEEINSYNKTWTSKMPNEYAYNIDMSFIDDSNLVFDVVIPKSDLVFNKELGIEALLKNYKNWSNKIVQLWNADGLYQTR